MKDLFLLLLTLFVLEGSPELHSSRVTQLGSRIFRRKYFEREQNRLHHSMSKASEKLEKKDNNIKLVLTKEEMEDLMKQYGHSFNTESCPDEECYCVLSTDPVKFYSSKRQDDSLPYVCCSCSSKPSDGNGCFPEHGVVSTSLEGETKSMGSLKTGDNVIAKSESGTLIPTTVIGFLDRNPKDYLVYLAVKTDSGETLSLTPNHIIFRENSISHNCSIEMSNPETVFARELSIGDTIYRMTKSNLPPTRIVSIKRGILKGAYVPVTPEGNLIVDGILVSCYASYPHSISHAFMKLARLFPWVLKLKVSATDSYNDIFSQEEPLGLSIYGAFGKMIAPYVMAEGSDTVNVQSVSGMFVDVIAGVLYVK